MFMKTTIVGVMCFLIFALSVGVAAVTADTIVDDVGDVYYQPGGGDPVQTDLDSQPNIDITQVKCSCDAAMVTIMVNVVGEIVESSQVLYYGSVESMDAQYQFTYSNGNLNCYVETPVGKTPVDAEVVTDGDTVQVMIPLGTNDTSMQGLYAYAHYYEDAEELMLGPKYIDTTTDIDSDDGSLDDKDGAGETPGFEGFVLLFAMLLFCIWRRAHN